MLSKITITAAAVFLLSPMPTVWGTVDGEALDEFPRTLHTHLRQLRKKRSPCCKETIDLVVDDAHDIPLIAGQHTDIGKVTLVVTSTEDAEFEVCYDPTFPWDVSKGHVYAHEDPPDKAAPGLFNFHGPPWDSDLCLAKTVNLDNDGCFYLAVHAEAEIPDVLTQLENVLPDECVNIRFIYDAANGQGYWKYVFDMDLKPPMPPFVTPQYGYCLEDDLTLSGRRDSRLYSSYDEDALKDIFDNYDRFPSINWLVNQQHRIGQDCITSTNPDVQACIGAYEAYYNLEIDQCTGQTYALSDFQRAIWWLIEDPEKPSTAGLISGWSDDKALQLTCEALEQDDFVPDCDQLFVVIIDPSCDGTERQYVMTWVELSCEEGDETAWALTGGESSSSRCFGTGWGEYYKVCVD